MGEGQERWDRHLTKWLCTKGRERAVTSGWRRERGEGDGHQNAAAGSDGHEGLTGGLGGQMVVVGSGGLSGGSCKMGGWEQYAGAHWAVIRETLHIRRDRRCSAGRGYTRTIPLFTYFFLR